MKVKNSSISNLNFFKLGKIFANVAELTFIFETKNNPTLLILSLIPYTIVSGVGILCVGIASLDSPHFVCVNPISRIM